MSATEKNRQTWWGQDAKRILDYIDEHRGNMSDFEVLEDIMCGSYVDWFNEDDACESDSQTLKTKGGE
tara:strand:+ start:609 stop:812 length:204 start_codon:yes stop_codon:yes gene_type:complete